MQVCKGFWMMAEEGRRKQSKGKEKEKIFPLQAKKAKKREVWKNENKNGSQRSKFNYIIIKWINFLDNFL